MSQIKLKQIKGLTPGSILYLNQNSVVAENFSNLNWNYTNNILNVSGSIKLDTGYTYSLPITPGEFRWDSDNNTVSLGLLYDVNLQLGQENYILVKNQTGSNILNGEVVAFAGTLGSSGRVLAQKMIADGSLPARYLIGIATHDILDGEDGYVTSFGKVNNLDTSMFSQGDILWVSPTQSGKLTNVEPEAPYVKISVASVINDDVNNGVILVRPTFSGKLNDLDDVNLTGINNNDLVAWDNGVLKPLTITQGTTQSDIVVIGDDNKLYKRSDLSLQGIQGIQGVTGAQGIQGRSIKNPPKNMKK